MPLNAFKEALQISGSGYNAKLQGLVGVGTAIKQGQVAKQQMQEQFQQQRDLIQLRADTQFDLQKRVHEEITGPAEEAQNFQQSYLKAQEAAQKRRVDLVDENSKRYAKLRDLGLLDVSFRTELSPETGFPEVKIYERDGEEFAELDYDTYVNKAEELLVDAAWFDKLEEGLDKGWFPEQYPEGQQFRERSGQRVERLTKSAASDILSAVRLDRTGSAAKRLLQDSIVRFDRPTPFEGEEEGETTPGVQRTKQLGTYFSRIAGNMNENGVINFQFVEEPNFWQKWVGRVPERTEMSIDIGSQDIESNKRQLADISLNTFGVDLIELERQPEEVRQQILSGNSDGLSGDAEDLADKINSLREDAVSEQEILKLFDTYFNLEPAADEWRREQTTFEAAQVPNSRLIPNIGAADPMKAFILKDVGDPTQRAYQQSLQYRQEASTRQ